MSICLAALPAIAALQCSPATAGDCNDKGNRSARLVVFEKTDPKIANGLHMSLMLGLSPATFDTKPFHPPSKCTRGHFVAGSTVFEMMDDDADAPPRIAIGGSPSRTIIWLVALPSPAAALKWSHDQPDAQRAVFPPRDLIYALSIPQEKATPSGYATSYRVFKFYDAIPETAALADDMCAALTGQFTPIVTQSFDWKIDMSKLGSKQSPPYGACLNVLH